MMKYITSRSALRLDVFLLLIALALLFVIPTSMSSSMKELVLAVIGILAGVALIIKFKNMFLLSLGALIAGLSILIFVGLLFNRFLGS